MTHKIRHKPRSRVGVDAQATFLISLNKQQGRELHQDLAALDKDRAAHVLRFSSGGGQQAIAQSLPPLMVLGIVTSLTLTMDGTVPG
ncbi:hypothetical protein ACIOEW_31990 [Streptomyces sp. NPDC087901]|uniref:hypothetical protein n=1 Tax=Streptomyces sp. NPDC087901 TaxID=3365818 RepID=UPI003819EE09